ncbi:trypsin-like serine protease [uncultured Zhongshania sp.]|uniref:trypsin-like serine peptidase n=1 Tax=uncultured Zhongshania sp. TaxID=1642288 RepID=UPI0025DEFD98|nr:trypsin-like serine protease [uncultured Zhongshania sp.]
MRTASIGLVLMFLLCSHKSFAECETPRFPAPTSQNLLPLVDSQFYIPEGVSKFSPCQYSKAELAQYYFWGLGLPAPDIEKAFKFAKQSLKSDKWPYELALLHAAFVIKGLDNSISKVEAVRRFQREILSGDALRRDKALATLNQLSEFLPRVKTVADAVYLDSALKQPAALVPASGFKLTARGNKFLILLADDNGAPSLYWATALADDSTSPHLVFQRRASLGAHGAEDIRQQLWRFPSSMPLSGVLLSRFIQSDGSLFESRCTATVLAAEWLISASHCLYTPNGEGHLQSLQFRIDSFSGSIPVAIAQNNHRAMAISSAWQHRQHHPQDQHNGQLGRYSGSDIALLKLATPIQLAKHPKLAVPDRQSVWVESLSYPNDKPFNTLWASRCRSTLWREGEQALSDLYVLDCFSHAGQSGAVLIQRGAGEGQIVGVLSARIYNDSINQPVFAAFTGPLIKEIRSIIAGEPSSVFIRMPINSGPNLAEANP